MEYGREIDQKLNQLAQYSSTTEGVTRLSLTTEHRQALELLRGWMEESGLETQVDFAGNLIGSYTPKAGGKTLFLGSHQDTVRQGGKYDGALGVVLPLVCLKTLIARGELHQNVKLLAFGDEEGTRFHTIYLGSKAYLGTLEEETLTHKDRDGISLAQAMADFSGGPQAKEAAVVGPGDAYVEVHIEQGPVLERENCPVGIVTSIQSSHRYEVCIQGEAGHAGTVPMDCRRDAGTAMAEAMVLLRHLALEQDGLVATVGEAKLSPGAVNVIPSQAVFSVDVRSPQESLIAEIMVRFAQGLEEICREQGTTGTITPYNQVAATQCDPRLVAGLKAATVSAGLQPYTLPSGAGHDAQEMHKKMPVAMLFVRTQGGISHSPQEAIAVEDMECAAQTLVAFLRNGLDAGDL